MESLDQVTSQNIIELWEQIVESAIGEAEQTIIKRIQSEIEELTKCPKQLGANSWYIVQCFKLSTNIYAVRLEEGHIANYLLLYHEIKENKFINLVESGAEV